MTGVSLRRALIAGAVNFRRNGWLTAATVMIFSLVLFVVGNLVFLGAFASTALSSFESKIDVSVYFSPEASEREILAVKREIEALPDVREVAYVSRENALSRFREQHKDNALISGALEELGDNPLQASVNIRAQDPSRYAAISGFLAEKKYPIVEKINYFENQAVIDRLSSVLSAIRGSGAGLTIFLALVAALVAFNTVRLAIYTMREEIGIMRLVGATAWFIRGPFLITGFLYGITAAVLMTLAFFPLTWLAAPRIAFLVPDFNLFRYFTANLVEFFAVMAGSGVALGVGSSYIAVRRYLTI